MLGVLIISFLHEAGDSDFLSFYYSHVENSAVSESREGLEFFLPPPQTGAPSTFSAERLSTR